MMVCNKLLAKFGNLPKSLAADLFVGNFADTQCSAVYVKVFQSDGIVSSLGAHEQAFLTTD